MQEYWQSRFYFDFQINVDFAQELLILCYVPWEDITYRHSEYNNIHVYIFAIGQ